MCAGWALACAPGPQPCASAGVCADGFECLANRCVPLGADPVAPGSERVLLEPEQVSVLDEGKTRSPGHFVLGGAVHGEAHVFISFPLAAVQTRSLADAFLLLEPVADPVSAGPIRLEVWRIASSWTGNTIGPMNQPRLAPPRAEGIAHAGARSTVRVDVTELVHFALNNPASAHGLAIVADAGEGTGASFSTGTTTGPAPRLEVYVR